MTNQMLINSEFKSKIETTLTNGWQLPSILYADPKFYEIELDAIFKKSWQYICLESKLLNSGDYFTAEIGNVPIVIVRDHDGQLKGHINACRHRLHPVAVGESGCKQLLQCRYHGWTYNLDGKLRSASGADQCQDFAKEGLSLIPIRVQIFRGFVFACIDEEVEPLENFIENADEILENMALDFSQWKPSGILSYDVDGDWKLFSENSLECYHCPLVHQDTFSVYVGTQPDQYITQEYNNILTHQAPIIKLPSEIKLESQKGFKFMFIWPSTLISMDDYVGTISKIIPLAPQVSRFHVETFVNPNADPHLLDQWIDVYDKTFKEDKEVVTAQQRVYRSGMIPQGRLMLNREPSIGLFQKRTWQALSADSRLPGLMGYESATELNHNRLPVWDITALDTPKKPQNSNSELTLRISQVERGAQGVSILYLSAINDAPLPDWLPGAHIDLMLPNGITRQYSLCGDLKNENQWRIGVLREPNSRGGSSYVHEHLAENTLVKVKGPRNHFEMPEAEEYRFVAGGIGITPILAMIQKAEQENKKWRLLYGGRSIDSMAFVKELKQYSDKVQFWPQDTLGLLDFHQYLADAPMGTAVCACGPAMMLDALTLISEQYPNVSLSVERFAAVQKVYQKNQSFDVELVRSKKTIHVTENQTILEAVRDSGISIYSSCESGICGTCETAVIAGEIEHRDSILTDSEKALGKSMMICVSRCTSGVVKLDL